MINHNHRIKANWSDTRYTGDKILFSFYVTMTNDSRGKVLEIVRSNRTESLETIDLGQEREQNDYVSG